MPFFVTCRELRRLERELSAARKRADDAEDRLASERQSKDWTILQLTSRFVTKQGGYALDAEQPVKAEPAPHPQGFIHEPDETDLARLEWYKKCYREAEKDEAAGVAFWEAEMRGESPAIGVSEAEQ